MIMRHLNVNILLCRKCDDEVNNIYNIFNEVKLNKDNMASFSIVTLLNGFDDEYEKISLYYYMQKCSSDGKNPFLYLGKSTIKMTSENKSFSTGEDQKCTKNNAIQEIFKSYLENVRFLGKGQYEIQVYLYKDGEIPEKDPRISKEIKKEVRNDEHLVALYDFDAT